MKRQKGLDLVVNRGEMVKYLATIGLTPHSIDVFVKQHGAQIAGAEAKTLLAHYKGIPKDVQTEIIANGVPRTKTAVDDLAAKYKLTPKQVATLMQVVGDVKAKAQIADIQARYKLTPKQLTTLFDASSAHTAQEKAKALQDYIDSMHGKSLKIYADTVAAESALAGIQAQVTSLHGKSIVLNVNTNYSHSGVQVGGGATASGGVFKRAQMRLIAEDGDEAVVPLRRPLSQVDPSVRALSAFAQGITSKAPAKSVVGGYDRLRAMNRTPLPPIRGGGASHMTDSASPALLREIGALRREIGNIKGGVNVDVGTVQAHDYGDFMRQMQQRARARMAANS